MGGELETRRNDKECLLQVLIAQFESSNPKELNRLLVWAKAKMEPEDVKLVMHEFEEWKKSID